MRDTITNSADIIDSRDIIARIDDLESERADLAEAVTEAESDDDRAEASANLAGWDDSDEAEELKTLRALADDAEGYIADWKHGETLIRDSYFVQYAQELAEDIGAINRDAAWPACHIDWDAAADALKQDYTALDFDGVTYWAR